MMTACCVTRGFINKKGRWHAYTVLVPRLFNGGPVPILLYWVRDQMVVLTPTQFPHNAKTKGQHHVLGCPIEPYTERYGGSWWAGIVFSLWAKMGRCLVNFDGEVAGKVTSITGNDMLPWDVHNWWEFSGRSKISHWGGANPVGGANV